MEIQLFCSELCIDFQEEYLEMTKKEAKYFHEAFSHFHNVMTQTNPCPLQNAVWLNENFMRLWNIHTPEDMLKEVLSYTVEHLSKQNKSYIPEYK